MPLESIKTGTPVFLLHRIIQNPVWSVILKGYPCETLSWAKDER
jgi:hypothetical protein